MWQWTPLEWLALVEHELLLFAAVFFLIGALDELLMDGAWVWLKVTGRARSWRIARSEMLARSAAQARSQSYVPSKRRRPAAS